MKPTLTLRAATPNDFAAICAIFREIIIAGDTLMYDETYTDADIRQLWFGRDVAAFVACHAGQVVGAYKHLPNQPGRGKHIVNGTYIVAAGYRGRGIGRCLVEHSLQQAKQAGYRAIQYNVVVSTNTGAIRLYESLGFQILATVPNAFNHRQLGYVDTYVMYRSLV